MDLTHVLVERLEYNISKIGYQYDGKSGSCNNIATIKLLSKLIGDALFYIKYRKANFAGPYGLCMSSYVLHFTDINKLKKLKCPRLWPLEKKNIHNSYIKDIITVWELLRALFSWDKYSNVIEKDWIFDFELTIPCELS